ncbi:MAG: helix-turn-helix domain-containing protein [Candidatus Woesearchaeota archaeon]
MDTAEQFMAQLQELGLNRDESKIYVALLKTGETTAERISKEADIPYGKAYDLLLDLCLKDVAIVRPTCPMRCRAVPWDAAIEYLKRKLPDKDGIDKKSRS